MLAPYPFKIITMKKYFIIAIFFLTVSANGQSSDQIKLDSIFKQIPDVSILQFAQIRNGLFCALSVKQPIDHKNPNKGYFNQRIILIHRGFDRINVMETNGYQINYQNSGNDIEKQLQANYLDIEHRYFGESKPDSLQWEYLTYEQEAEDLHHINQIFKSIYKNKWISIGYSRGGQNAIHYKYFFPNDVDVTIPIVASIQEDYIDKRFFKFLDTIGTKECRNKILAVQQYLLVNKKQVLDKLNWYAKGQELTFDYMGSLEKAFEYCILEYPFAFWQFGSDCSKIPTNKNLDDYLENVLEVSSLEYAGDKKAAELFPHYYMSESQSGYYGYDLTNLSKYLKYYKGLPSANLPPKNIKFKPFDNTYLKTLVKWLDENGNNMIYINGSLDPYSSCRVIPSKKVNSKSYYLINKDHVASQSLKSMTDEMRKDFSETLSKMLGEPIEFK